jgi:hypothetical protein
MLTRATLDDVNDKDEGGGSSGGGGGGSGAEQEADDEPASNSEELCIDGSCTTEVAAYRTHAKRKARMSFDNRLLPWSTLPNLKRVISRWKRGRYVPRLSCIVGECAERG